MRDLRVVGEGDRDLAGLGIQRRLVELQRAAGVRRQRELLPAAPAGARGARPATRARLVAGAPAARHRQCAGQRERTHPSQHRRPPFLVQDGLGYARGASPVRPVARRAVNTTRRSLRRTIRSASYSPRRAAVVSTTYAVPSPPTRNVPALALHAGESQWTS